MNTRPSIRVVRILPSASGWRAMPSADFAVARPMAIAPPAAAMPTARPAARAFMPRVLSAAASAAAGAASPSSAMAGRANMTVNSMTTASASRARHMFFLLRSSLFILISSRKNTLR